MPSKLNSEFNYRYQVMGETPWEKLKILRGFLEGRLRAVALEEVSRLKMEAKRSELAHMEEIGALRHVILNLRAEIMEADSVSECMVEAYKLNHEEVATLRRLIEEILIIAEPTRIAGYTDEQMYEANAANEFTVMIAKEIHAEIIANGRPSPAKVRNAMSNPHTWAALKSAGLIPVDAPILIGGAPSKIELLEAKI